MLQPTADYYQAGVRYYELRKSTPAGLYTVNEQATFAPGAGDGAAGDNRWMASAAMDVQGIWLSVTASPVSRPVISFSQLRGQSFR